MESLTTMSRSENTRVKSTDTSGDFLDKNPLWEFLPNASQIDRILNLLVNNPLELVRSYSRYNTITGTFGLGPGVRDEALRLTRIQINNLGRGCSLEQSIYKTAARNVVGASIFALIAYDDCAHYLDMRCDQLRHGRY